MKTPTITRLRREHLEQVARMRLHVFQSTFRAQVDAVAKYLGTVFLDNPWNNGNSLSRVMTQGDRVVGFIGLIPRPMWFRGRRILMACVSHVMVDPESRGMGLGGKLLANVFEGEQDLTLSDVSNQALRSLWHAQGGVTHTLGCLTWERSFRPLRSASRILDLHPALRLTKIAARPLARILDPFLASSPRSGLYVPSPSCSVEPCELADQVDVIQPLLEAYALSPVYTEASFRWLLHHLDTHPSIDEVRGALIHEGDGRAIGWTLTAVNQGIHGQVIQLGSLPGSEATVIHALVHSSGSQGLHTLRGRVSPSLVEGLSSQGATFIREDPWVLVHSRRPEILVEILAGSAHLSRLEGEWWVAA